VPQLSTSHAQLLPLSANQNRSDRDQHNLAEEIGAVLSESQNVVEALGSATPRVFKLSSLTPSDAKICSTTTARAACWMTTPTVGGWRAFARCAAT